MTSQMYLCLALFILMIVGYVFGGKIKLTNGIVGLTTIIVVSLTGLVPAKSILSLFLTKNSLHVIGMFIVAAGLSRTQAVNKMSSLVYKISGGSFRKVLAGYSLMCYALTSLGVSPLTTFSIVGPLAAACCSDFNISPSKMIFPVGLVCVGCGGSLPIGPGAANYSIMNGYLESFGYTTYQMQLMDTPKCRVPIAIFIILYAIFIAPKFCPAQCTVPPSLSNIKKKELKEAPPLDPVREALGYGVFALVTLCLIFQNKILPNLESWQISMTGAVLLLFTGVLKPKEGINAIPMRVVLMLAGAQAIGAAMDACGLGDLIGNAISTALGGTTNGYTIGAVFYTIPMVLTQFMNNGSVGNIFRPVVILTCKALACNPVGPLMLMRAGMSTAFLTPMATGAMAIVMDLGGYDQKDLLKMGILPAIVVAILSVIWTMTIFPVY